MKMRTLSQLLYQGQRGAKIVFRMTNLYLTKIFDELTNTEVNLKSIVADLMKKQITLLRFTQSFTTM